MKKVSVSGYAVCEVIQEVEVEDNATAQKIREKAEEEFEGLGEYGDDSVSVSGNAKIHSISDGEVNFKESYNELVPAPTIMDDTQDNIRTKYKSIEEAQEYLLIDNYKEQYPGRQYQTSSETATLRQAIKWNRDYILNLVHTVINEYKNYESGWYCKICIDNESHNIYRTSFMKSGSDIKVTYKKATEIMTLYTEQLKNITDDKIERQIDRILDTLEK
ncbi:hypothetical protein KM800_02910 [Clostridium tyrobutyricum]|uniref:hypothetical protein n=1 Tax=Clostridium tyrobutyricum TaxID=1519 RepID=UPI001C389355|nr:hypothetical protein [Clostridium tyrobutyricum]MBV4418284.1 hypothetical protein [Clostridium tyrobutyricum]